MIDRGCFAATCRSNCPSMTVEQINRIWNRKTVFLHPAQKDRSLRIDAATKLLLAWGMKHIALHRAPDCHGLKHEPCCMNKRWVPMNCLEKRGCFHEFLTLRVVFTIRLLQESYEIAADSCRVKVIHLLKLL